MVSYAEVVKKKITIIIIDFRNTYSNSGGFTTSESFLLYNIRNTETRNIIIIINIPINSELNAIAI